MATFVLLPCASEFLVDGTIDADTDTLKVAFLTSSASAVIATATQWSDVSSYEITTTGGYTSGGYTLANCSYTRSSGTTTFDCDDTVVTASGGDIDAHRYHFFYKSGTANGVTNPAFAYGYDNISSDIPATVDGTSITLRYNASGLYTSSV